jgi:multidrug resistance efflux pump
MSIEGKTADIIYEEMITANRQNHIQYHKDGDTERAIKRSKEIDSQKWVPLEEAQKLEADIKRANKKLDTIDAVAKQLVHMTNIATNHRIQIDEAKKQLEEAMDCYDMTREENYWMKDLYEGLINECRK